MESQKPEAPNGARDGSGAGAGGRTFGERVERVSDNAQQAWARTRDAIDDIKETVDLQGRVDRHPYGTLAAAVGIGYVLGGGLFSPLTARLLGLGLRMGLRMAAIPVLRDELFGFAEALGRGATGGRGGGAADARATADADIKKERQP
jgi:hypothetical protein